MKKLFLLLILFLGVVCSTSCKQDNSKVITVGASVSPHAEILEQCKDYVSSKGYTLNIVTYSDYILPNTAVEDGSLDANYFQHQDYLNNFNAENNTHLVSVLNVHFEPLGLYGNDKNYQENIKDGASIGIPNDPTNCARALLLLDYLGIISVDTSKGMSTTKADITENPYNVEIVLLEAAQLPIQLSSFDYCVINGNYALSGKVTDRLVASEAKDSDGAKVYPNVICVKEGNEESEKIKVLIEALSQDSIRDYINSTYNGLVVPLF